jgi:hypothetical protein
MDAPKITVKKVQSFRGRKGIGASADVYLDGVHVGYFLDEANGGEFDFTRVVHMDDKKKDALVKSLIKQLEDYAASLHPVDINADKKFGNKPLMIQPTAVSMMDDVINAELQKKEDAKFAKRMEKQSMKGILYGTKNKYSVWAWKIPLTQLIQTQAGRAVLQTRVNRVQLELKKGESILNAEYLKSLGITIP